MTLGFHQGCRSLPPADSGWVCSKPVLLRRMLVPPDIMLPASICSSAAWSAT